MASGSTGSGGGRRSLPPQDLSKERALRDCAQAEFEGARRRVLGRIVLLAKLGRGGMGAVYYGINPRLETEVAVKVLPPEVEEGQEGAIDRFQREARLAAGLYSEHLVSVLDVDQDAKSGLHYIVMEFVHGVTAARWTADLAARGGRASEKDALDVCIAATKGLAAAHVEGILHRDVKPENVLVPRAADGRLEFERAKLADLGLARHEAAGEGLTATSIGMGTPGFMSAEQAHDARGAKKPADVFSMGATLYALLTGEPPFRGKSAMETLMLTMRGECRPVRERRPDVSQATAALLARCLALEPAKRFPDAPALLDALEICRASLDAPAAAEDTMGRIERLALAEERGKRVVSAPPPAPARPAHPRRRRVRRAASNPVGAFAVLGVLAVAGMIGWTALHGDEPAKIAPPRPATPETSEATETGIYVTSEPTGGIVSIDGQVVGEAPRFRPYKPYGTHDVRVTLPGFAKFEKSPVVVRADGRTVVEASLVRAFNALEITGGAPGGAVRLVREGEPPKQYEGTLDADGALTLRPVEAGAYAATIERAGFGAFRARVVVPSEGGPARLAAGMIERPGKVSLDSDPPGAAVFVDDKRVGAAPLVGAALPAGKRVLVVRCVGCVEKKLPVVVRGDATTELGVVRLDRFATADLSALSPGVVAKVDGEVVAAGGPLRPGVVVMTLERAGYAPQTRRLDAAPGAKVPVSEDPWDGYQAQVDLSSLPAGTRVILDGEEVKASVVGRAATCKVPLELRRPGYEPERVEVAATLGAKSAPPAVAWKELKTQFDRAELSSGLALWVDGKPSKEGATIKPGPHVLQWSGMANSEKWPFEVECQRFVRPPSYGTTPGVRAALDWLARHQSPDGRWSSNDFGVVCRGACGGPGHAGLDVGVTGLSLLAFLGAGETPRSGPHKDVVRDGLRCVATKQDQWGAFAAANTEEYTVQSAVATLAVATGYLQTGDVDLRDAAQRGVAFILKAKNPYLAWRYGVADGANDTEATFWMVRALHAAHRAEFAFDRHAVDGAVAWVDKMTEPEFGRTGYQQKGGPSNRDPDMKGRFPPETSHCLTSAGVLVRLWAMHSPKDDEFIGKGADLVFRTPPRWDTGDGSIDFCSWHCGTLLASRVFGADSWKTWREQGVAALAPHQRAEPASDERGSWDPVDAWSAHGGRVYATAINCLTLEYLGK